MKKRLTIGVLILFLAVVASGCGAAKTGDAQKIKIAYLPITHALPVLELQKQLEAKNGGVSVELVKYGSWPELMDALNTGRVDGASVLIELAMKAKEQGIDLKAVALGHHDGNVIVVGNTIMTAAELRGKTLAIPHRLSSHHLLIEAMLEKNGMTAADVAITELSPTEMPSALASGQIAGYCVAEPFGAKAVAMGVGKVLYDSAELWSDSVCCGLVLTGDFITRAPAEAKALTAAYSTAGDALDKAEAQGLAEDRLGLEASVAALSLQWIDYTALEITEADYKNLSDRMKKYGLMENPPAYEDFVDTTLLP